jgi:hypothetical protein
MIDNQQINRILLGISLGMWTLIAWALFPLMKNVFRVITPEIIGQYLVLIVFEGYILIVLFAIILGKNDTGARIMFRAKRFLKKGESFP